MDIEENQPILNEEDSPNVALENFRKVRTFFENVSRNAGNKRNFAAKVAQDVNKLFNDRAKAQRTPIFAWACYTVIHQTYIRLQVEQRTINADMQLFINSARNGLTVDHFGAFQNQVQAMIQMTTNFYNDGLVQAALTKFEPGEGQIIQHLVFLVDAYTRYQ